MLHDVVIVGAGPAGSTLAYRLASDGLKVALLEKEHFPRMKPCGGGLDGLFQKYLPEGMDYEAVVEGRVDTAVVSYQGKRRREYPMPVPMYMAQRTRLDEHLARQATEAGADLVEGAQVTELSRGHWSDWEVRTKDGRNYHAPIVVGADGALGVVAKLAGIPQYPDQREVFLASEWDVEATGQDHADWQGKVLIDTSVFPLGYGWIFPKSDHLNIGFGVSKKHGKRLNEITQTFADERSGLTYERVSKHSHWVPFANRGAPVVKDGVMLIGDAGGFADPATGAGISWGVKSAALAAGHITRAVSKGDPSLTGFYQHDALMMQEDLAAGMALRNLLVLSFALRHETWSTIFETGLRCLGGQQTYLDWAKRHPWQFRLGNFLQRTLVPRLI